jgi:hypothetical protein
VFSIKVFKMKSMNFRRTAVVQDRHRYKVSIFRILHFLFSIDRLNVVARQIKRPVIKTQLRPSIYKRTEVERSSATEGGARQGV